MVRWCLYKKLANVYFDSLTLQQVRKILFFCQSRFVGLDGLHNASWTNPQGRTIWGYEKNMLALRPSAEWPRSRVWPTLSMVSQKSTLIWSQDGWPQSEVPRLQSLRNHSGLFAAGSEFVGFFPGSFHSATSWKVNFLLQTASKENKWSGKGEKSPSGL